MKKMGCASCGGAMKKMQKGGSAEIVGMPKYGNNPRTSTGAMLKKGGSVAKAKFGATVAVQRSPKSGKVTGVDGGYAKVGQREPARNKFAKGGATKKLVKAQDGSIVSNNKKGRSTSNGKNFDAYENNKTGTITIARTSRNPSNSSKGVRSLYVLDDKFLKPGGNTYYKKEDVKFTKNPVNNLIKDYNTVRKSAGLPEKKYRDITTSSSQLKKEGTAQKAKGVAMKAKGQSMKADGKTLKAAAQILNKKKTGGASTAFEKLAPPYNKATFADRIAGAKKRTGKK
jgi:hypothetical protein